jgi:hypothetical protein
MVDLEGAWDDVCQKISGICAASGLPGLQIVVKEGELLSKKSNGYSDPQSWQMLASAV